MACSALLLNVLSETDIRARDREPVALVGYALPEIWIGGGAEGVSGVVGAIEENKQQVRVGAIEENNQQAQQQQQQQLVTQQNQALVWCIKTILRCTPASSVHVIMEGGKELSDGTVLARGGVVGLGDKRSSSVLQGMERMNILNKAISDGEEVYLPDIQILPGKIEFSYLPINFQSVLIIPIGGIEGGKSGKGGKGVLVKGAKEGQQTRRGALVIATNQAKVLRLPDLNKIRTVTKFLQQQLWC